MNHHLSSLRDWLHIADTAQRQGTPRVLAAALTEIAQRATVAASEVIQPPAASALPATYFSPLNRRPLTAAEEAA